MIRNKYARSLFFFIIIASVLMAILMNSVIAMYLTDEYNPRYYIYQALLYGLAGYVVVKNRRNIHAGSFVGYMWAFSACCFLFSFVQLTSLSVRSVISLFFNTFIVPISFLNGIWLGTQLVSLKDRDLYLILIQIPALYSMIMLQSFTALGSWFHADAAFCVVVFMPFIFFFKRKWLSMIFSLIYVLFSLTSAKRSILLFVLVSIIIYSSYIFLFQERKGRKGFWSKVLVFSFFLLGFFYIVNQQSDALGHTIERTERLGGITEDNGRTGIYTRVLQEIFDSKPIYFLFGHGHMAVSRDTGMGAHNDLLEISYDYGIIAALLYMLILIHFIIVAYRCFHDRRYEYGIRISISVSSILILGFLNCIVTSTILEYSMFLVLGTSIALKDSDTSII